MSEHGSFKGGSLFLVVAVTKGDSKAVIDTEDQDSSSGASAEMHIQKLLLFVYVKGGQGWPVVGRRG